jgi:hypothetical protein
MNAAKIKQQRTRGKKLSRRRPLARWCKHAVALLWVLPVFLSPTPALADVLIGSNGERFVGTVKAETSTNVVFDSELGGRLTFPRAKVREIQRTPAAETGNATMPPVISTNTVTAQLSSNPPSWKPPGVGHDGADWIQLKSGEWLRGDLKYIQNKDVEFDSDELDLQTFDLSDVRSIYTAHRVFTRFEEGEALYGRVIISNKVVMVNAEPPVNKPVDELMGITPSGGRTGIRNWSGNAMVGVSLQSGNTHQTTVTSSAELARRTPTTTLLLDYLGNYSQVDDVQSVNNDRFNATYDIRLTHDWFVRPVQAEAYHDPLANISYRLTGGVGGGYYIFDRTGLEWTVAAGPSYQYTRFETVEPGQARTATTPAGVLSSKFKADITDRLTFIQSWQSTFTSKESGQYTHHAVSTLEFEIKRHLNLDVSFIWDYLQNPQQKSDGTFPQKSDTYLTVGFGVRF